MRQNSEHHKAVAQAWRQCAESAERGRQHEKAEHAWKRCGEAWGRVVKAEQEESVDGALQCRHLTANLCDATNLISAIMVWSQHHNQRQDSAEAARRVSALAEFIADNIPPEDVDLTVPSPALELAQRQRDALKQSETLEEYEIFMEASSVGVLAR